MQAIINIDQIRVSDVPDKSPATGMMLETKTRKVIVTYTVPEMNMTRTIQVNHPATIAEIKAAVLACVQSCSSAEQQAAQYKADLADNNTVEF